MVSFWGGAGPEKERAHTHGTTNLCGVYISVYVCVVYGCGVWSVEYGVWSMECGVSELTILAAGSAAS